MIFLVTGGRSFGCSKGNDGKLIVNMSERNYIYDVLDAVCGDHPFITLRHGDCPTGADRVADAWAKRRGHDRDPHPAKWNAFGKIAGPMRNQQMIDKEPRVSLCIAFPGGDGTADCVARAVAADIPVFEARYDKPDKAVCKEKKPVVLSAKSHKRKRNERAPGFDF